MATTFDLFPRFPPEIRLLVWEYALALKWTCTNFHRVKQRIKTSGKNYHKEIGRVCREARQVMKNRLTEVERLGWFDFERHLFFFRDLEASRGLMKYMFDHFDLKPFVQHILINPRDAAESYDTIKFVTENCNSICTIVIVAPWFTPYRTGPFDVTKDFICSYEDWSRVICKSPTELNLEPLVNAIHFRARENDACLKRYRSRLSQDVARLPDQLPSHLRFLDHESWRTRKRLNDLQALCASSIAPSPPKIFLRTREEVLNDNALTSLWAGGVDD